MTQSQGDTIGRRVAQARRELGVRLWRDVNAAELGRMAELPASTITRIENDQQEPSGGTLVKLARTLGVTERYIMTGERPTDLAPPAPRVRAEELLQDADVAATKRRRRGA